jgi:hypothetical protein
MADEIRVKIKHGIGEKFYSITTDGWSQMASPELQRLF